MVNELNKRDKFYYLYGAEAEVRLWASKHSNSYLVCIFACCREQYNKLRHSGCYGGTKEEAQLSYDAEVDQQMTADLIKSKEDQDFKIANAALR